MKLGVCCYPEHWPPERWPIDAKLMREAGLSIARMGEFAWQQMEPKENKFAWSWLDQAIDVYATENLQIILCTPTAAPPAWLCKAYPDILPVDSQGRRRRFGSRRHYCANSTIYHQLTVRIVSTMAERYGRHPAVIGWQIDNEFGCHDTARCYCESCAAAFRRWLERKYKTIDILNDAWGTAFWSQVYSDWREIDPPFLTVTEPNPSHVLDYYRFSSDSVVAYQQMQIDILRRHALGKPVTTNFMGNFPDLNYHDLAHPLDLVAWDSYPTGYAEVAAQSLYSPTDLRPAFAYDVGDPYVTGFCHDLTRGLKQMPFWVMEQQCGNINWSVYNTGVRPGTVRLWTWHALACGADAVVYFRDRACLFAQEQYHSGLLHHDGTPAVGYRDLITMLPEREQMAQIAGEPVTVQVALLLDYNSLWAVQLQPHRKDFGYWRHLFVFYRALQRLGIPTDIVSAAGDLSKYNLIVAPTALLATNQLASKLTRYANNGGTVLFGVRSGFKTDTNRVTDQSLPGPLRDLVGATINDWSALPPGVGFDLQSRIPGLTGPATVWAESLTPLPRGQEQGITANAQPSAPLAVYTSGPFTSNAALTECPVGTGRALYLGWYPTDSQVTALLHYLAKTTSLTRLAEFPEGIIAACRGAHTILLNFTDEPLTATINSQPVRVESRDVRVFRDGSGDYL